MNNYFVIHLIVEINYVYQYQSLTSFNIEMEMELKYMDNVYKWKGNVPHNIVTCGPILSHMKDKSISH